MRLLFLPLFFAFTGIGLAHSQNCNNEVPIGYINICLPEIIGMEECYSDPLVGLFYDSFKGGSDEIILGAYLLDEVYEDRYEHFFEDGAGDEYIKVFTLEELQNIYVDEEDLDYMYELMCSALEEYDESLKNRIDKALDDALEGDFGFDVDIQVGKPVLIKKYNHSENIRSFIVITKFVIEDYKFVQVMVSNLAIVNNRMLLYAYYKEYFDSEDIRSAKSSSDYLNS